MHSSAPRRPSRLGLYLPFGILAIVCLLWSGFWFYASAKTGELMDDAFAREAKAGRDWTCPGRSVSGFPFRIELICDAPTFVSRVEGRAGEGRLGRLLVQARAIDPTRAIATLTGPLVVKTVNAAAELNWNDAKMSLATDTAVINDFSLDVQGLTASVTNGSSQPVLGGAHRVSVAIGQDGPQAPTAADYKIALKVDGLTLAQLDTATANAQPLNLEIQALAAKVPRLPNRDWRVSAEEWRSGNGTLKVILFDLVKGPMRLGLSGDLGIDAAHYPTGRLEASFQGLDAVAGQLGAKSLAGLVRSGRLPMLLSSGKLFVGPLPLANLTPLY